MMNFFISSPTFGLILSLAVYIACVWLHRRFSYALLTPLLTATVCIIAILTIFNIPYVAYQNGAKYLNYFLIPATICFAVPMYRQIKLLGKYRLAVLISLLIGSIVSVSMAIILCWIFGLPPVLIRSLVSISITTALAMGVTTELGGIVALTVFSVIITGILGNAIGASVCRILKIQNPVARGLAIGGASHAMGTVRAMEMGQIEGAMSSMSIVISGLITVIIAPIMLWILG